MPGGNQASPKQRAELHLVAADLPSLAGWELILTASPRGRARILRLLFPRFLFERPQASRPGCPRVRGGRRLREVD